MSILLAVYAAVCVITFLAAPAMGAGWAWDADNALGFAAFAGMLYLTIPVASRRDIRTHELLGYAVLFMALAHAFWFLLADAAAAEYVKFGAPDFMWLGLASVLLLFLLVTLAVLPTRPRVHRSYSAFKYWHRLVGVLAIASAAYHIVVSDFYLQTWYQKLLFVILAAAISFGLLRWIDRRHHSVATPRAFLTVSIIGTALFAAIRNLSW